MEYRRFTAVGQGAGPAEAHRQICDLHPESLAAQTARAVEVGIAPMPLPAAERVAAAYFDGYLSVMEITADGDCAAIGLIPDDACQTEVRELILRSHLSPDHPDFRCFMDQALAAHLGEDESLLEWDAVVQFTVWEHDTRSTLMVRNGHLPAPEMLLSRGYLVRHHTLLVTLSTWRADGDAEVGEWLLFGIATAGG